MPQVNSRARIPASHLQPQGKYSPRDISGVTRRLHLAAGRRGPPSRTPITHGSQVPSKRHGAPADHPKCAPVCGADSAGPKGSSRGPTGRPRGANFPSENRVLGPSRRPRGPAGNSLVRHPFESRRPGHPVRGGKPSWGRRRPQWSLEDARGQQSSAGPSHGDAIL